MDTNYNYTCPTCSQECSVEETLTGQNVLCPHCSQEFFATPPDGNTQVIIPEKLPFFKSGRRKILEDRLQQLVADGEMSAEDENTLRKTAILLGLEQSDFEEIGKREFLKEIGVVVRRMESSWQCSDDDLQEIDSIKKKFGITRFSLEGNASLFRKIYYLEAKGQLPERIIPDLMLEAGEDAYYRVASTWHQMRVHRRGYAGTSVSLPTGIKGVRFRFGQYDPIRSEEITPLASGTLWVTSKRLLFQGDKRNTKVEHKKIIDTTVYSDSLRVEKATGKPDYFSMNAAQARFLTSLIGHFKG